MKLADLNPPLGHPGGVEHLEERIVDEVDDPRKERQLLQKVDDGVPLQDFDVAAIYDLHPERFPGARLLFTRHAQYRMDLRGISVPEVRKVLLAANDKAKGDPELAWQVSSGQTIRYHHKPLNVLVVFERDGLNIRIITVYRPGEPNPYKGMTVEASQKSWHGLKLKIECPKGGKRSGIDPEGNHWERILPCAYGEILGSEGVDGDRVDVYVGDDKASEYAYVIRQCHPDTGVYDEDKVMLDFPSQAEAEAVYRSIYERPGYMGGITAMLIDDFIQWISDRSNAGKRIAKVAIAVWEDWALRSGDAKSILVAHYVNRKTASDASALRIAMDMEDGVPEALVAHFSLRTAGLGNKLRKLVDLLKIPKALAALKEIGATTIDGVKKLAEEGKRALASIFKKLSSHWLFHPEKNLPTLTELVRRTVIGAKIGAWFDRAVRPKADMVDKWLKSNLPTLRRALIAAIFIFIWLNVDELSWDVGSLIQGFMGSIDLADLLVSLPESAIGLLTRSTIGIGITIMPYVLAARVAWLLANHYLEWDGKRFAVNWKKVDKKAFDAA